ncbi:sulfotransferase [Litoricolaceae bacterium]|nr:sulfotransferase [Litorivicinaceae bacterium]
MELVREIYEKEVVFVSGITRSGKSLVCSVLSSFSGVEKTAVDFVLEQIPRLYGLKLIDTSTAQYLLRTGLNNLIYEEHLGRSLNLRQDDQMTSVFKYVEPAHYLARLSNIEGMEAVRQINRSDQLFLMMIHYGIEYLDLWMDSFVTAKMINVERNPIDLVDSWLRKGYGGDFFGSVRSTTPAVRFKENVLPYSAVGWEDEYIEMSPEERVVRTILLAIDRQNIALQGAGPDYADRVLNIRHETLVTQPELVLGQFGAFLRKSPSIYTASILARESVPRCNSALNRQRENKLNSLRNTLSKPVWDDLVDASSVYNELSGV